MPIEPNGNVDSIETDPIYIAEKPTLATKIELETVKNLAIALAVAL